jgi:hypothetical protein
MLLLHSDLDPSPVTILAPSHSPRFLIRKANLTALLGNPMGNNPNMLLKPSGPSPVKLDLRFAETCPPLTPRCKPWSSSSTPQEGTSGNGGMRQPTASNGPQADLAVTRAVCGNNQLTGVLPSSLSTMTALLIFIFGAIISKVISPLLSVPFLDYNSCFSIKTASLVRSIFCSHPPLSLCLLLRTPHYPPWSC